MVENKIPNGHKINQIAIKNPMAVNASNGHKIYQHFPFQGPPKFTQI
jgi:hypothetical protein